MDISDGRFVRFTELEPMDLNQQTATHSSPILAYTLRGMLILFGIIVAVTFVMVITIFMTWGDPYGLNTFQKIVMPVIITITFMMGWLINKRHPGHTIALLFLIMAYSLVWGPITLVVLWLNEKMPGPFYDQLDGIAKTISEISWIPGVFIPLFFMPFYFPTGKLLSRHWRAAVIWQAIGMLWYGLSIILRPWPWPENDMVLTRAPSVNGIAGSEAFFDQVQGIMAVIGIPAFLMVPLSMFLRYRRADHVERIQMKWPMTAIGLLLISVFLATVLPGWSRFDAEYGYPITWTLAMLFPISIGVGILRHRLFDIDVFISRAVVYGSLTAMIVALYILIVSGLGAVLQAQTTTLSGIIATAIVAVIFQPLRERLQRVVNRLMYGERDDPTAVLSQLAHHLETAGTPLDILPNLVQTIAQALRIPYVAIWSPTDTDRMEVVTEWGQPPEQREMISLIYQNQTIGYLVVAQRGANEQFNANERSLLTTIAALTATTVRAVQLSNELRLSRQRIITAREEERRRIRRDLHDGLGPQLASQTLSLEAIAQQISTDPQKAQSLLKSLQTQAHEAILDIRRLVYDLRPPALDDLGLVGALKQSAARYESGDLRFKFELADLRADLPAAVETAAFRIIQEAMTNVVRHAKATQCTIRLYCTEYDMMVEVEDDGCGMAQQSRSGLGLQTMSERAAELNGQTILDALPQGGTLIKTRLPLEV